MRNLISSLIVFFFLFCNSGLRAENKIRLLEILINENCSLINIKLSDLTKKYPNLKANVIGVIREDKFFIPKKTDEVKINDKIYVIINSTQMSETLEAFGHTEKVSKKILIVGGGMCKKGMNKKAIGRNS